MVDINNDGYKDFYISSAGSPEPQRRRNRLFINNGDTTFTERAQSYGIADTSYTTQAAFFDYDGDRDLDLFLLNHAHEIQNLNTPKPINNTGKDPSTDKLYENNGDGTFSNKISKYLNHQSWSGMGTDAADYTNDGLVDIFVLDMLPESNVRQKMMSANPDYEQQQYIKSVGYKLQYMRNTMQLNIGNGMFSEIGQLAGVDKTDWSWSSLMADFNNDGYKDLFVTNGYLKDMTFLDFVTRRRRLMMFKDKSDAEKTLLKELESRNGIKPVNKLFKNNGDLTFSDKTKSWGFTRPSFSNGAAYGDLDNDGDLDLVVNNINEKAFLYKNQTSDATEKTFLNVELSGKSPNSRGIGTKVSLYNDGNHQFLEKNFTRGYQSSVTDVLHFGLGKAKVIDSVRVVWPDDHYQTLEKIEANQNINISYSNAHSVIKFANEEKEYAHLFKSNLNIKGLKFLHQDNQYNDFKEHQMLPQMYSHGGPGLAVGDIDQNGFDDIYIGGAANRHGSLFMQQQDGQFSKERFSYGEKYEDMGTLFFDADEDGDLDLYITSGGSSSERLSLLQDRLYLNDGKGHFQDATDRLPNIQSSGSCVTAADYDRDGDLDLFTGGRIQPGNYPYPPPEVSCLKIREGSLRM